MTITTYLKFKNETPEFVFRNQIPSFDNDSTESDIPDTLSLNNVNDMTVTESGIILIDIEYIKVTIE